MQITAGPQAFYGGELFPAGADRQDEAAIHASAVEHNGARAALTTVTPFLGPGQVEMLAQHVEDGRTVIETDAAAGAIDAHHQGA